MRATPEPIEKQTQRGLDTVLVAVGSDDLDRLDRLAEEVLDVVSPAGATVVLGHVFTEDEYEDRLDNLGFEKERDEVTPDDVARRHSVLRELVETLESAGVTVEVRGATGHLGTKLTELADETEADLLFVGGRKRSPTGKAVFGSVAQEVMLSAPCPVTFVRADTK